jgi:translocator protein
MTMKHPWLGLVAWLAICFAAAAIGSAVTAPNIDNWYAQLAKPAWNPPNWVFGPVWTILYILMAVAAWLVWKRHGLAGARTALAVFIIQLVLNAAWSWIFFGLHRPGVAFFEVLGLAAAILATMILFFRRSVLAGVLLVPYFLWVSFASVLNFAIWKLN